MTTPEQLLADADWRRRHSVYTLWAIFGLGFISLLYTGARAKRNDWIRWGVIYGVPTIAAFAIVGSLSPEDPEAPTPAGVNLAGVAWIVVWVISAVHVFRTRKEWLRWKVSEAAKARWYESPNASPAANTPSADLSGIGLSDPTSEYLAGPLPAAAPPAPSVAWESVPPPPMAPPERGRERTFVPPPARPPRTAEEPAPPTVRPSAVPTQPVDLNTASVDDIAALPGVGVATAHRIVEERQRRGGFESVDEAALAVTVQPHVRARLQQLAVVSARPQPKRQGRGGRIVDI